MSSYAVPATPATKTTRRKSIRIFQAQRLRGSVLTVGYSTVSAIDSVLLMSTLALFAASLICLGPSLFDNNLKWEETFSGNATRAWWDEIDVSIPEPVALESSAEPESPEPESPEPESPEPEPEPVGDGSRRERLRFLRRLAEPAEEPEPEGLGKSSARSETEPEPGFEPEPEAEGEPAFDGNIYIRAPWEGIPTFGTKFVLFDYDFSTSGLTAANIHRCIFPTVVAVILGLTGLALERKTLIDASERPTQELFDDIAFRISRRRLLMFAYKKTVILNGLDQHEKVLDDRSVRESEWISSLFEEEACRFRRIVMKRRFRFRNVFCLHNCTATLYFYILLVTLVATVGYMSYTVRSAPLVRKNIVLYCLLLPLVEVLLVPTIKKLTLRCHIQGVSNKWYYQNTSGPVTPEYSLFLTTFRALVVNSVLFPFIISWNPLSAWTVSHALDTGNKSSLLLLYMQRWIFSSSEILIYVWSSSLTNQMIGLVREALTYYSKNKAVHLENEVPLFLGSTFYVVYMSCYVGMVTSNPFVFAVAAISILTKHCLFLLRAKMRMKKYKLPFANVRISGTTMFSQNAWAVFSFVFAPCSQAITCFFLLPFSPSWTGLVFILNALTSGALLVAFRHRWPSVRKRKSGSLKASK